MGKIGAKLGQVKETARGAAEKAGSAVKNANGPSPNPMTNLLLTDIALRSSGRLLRNAIEKGVLGVKYPQDKASNLVKGRSLTNTLITTAVARIATRSVPGALLVGGGLLAKTLFDRRKGQEARAAGQAKVEERAQRAPKKL